MRIRQISYLFRHHSTIINRLRVLWVVLILWFEIGIFQWSLVGCNWPDSIWKEKSRDAIAGDRPSPGHLMIVADTQVLDAHSLHSVPLYLRSLVTFVVESNLRKNWKASLRLKPHGVLFLGDMINGGRYAHSADEYDLFAERFHQLLHTNHDIPTYYVVGNHDVGLGRSAAFSHRARSRYGQSFNVSDPNQVVQFGNHTLVLLDAPGLVEEDYKRVNEDKVYSAQMAASQNAKKIGKVKATWTPIKGGSVEFVKKVAQNHTVQSPSSPLILFSHIPLARPERANCGPLREGLGASSRIQRGAGPGYQNLLGKATSTWLLEELKPAAIFSADDHDYCEFIHSYLPSGEDSGDGHLGEDSAGATDTVRKIMETTVKSFSMAAGIRHPGVQLLSLWNPLSNGVGKGGQSLPTFADRACLLPDQTRIYSYGYFPIIFLTTVLLAWMNLKVLASKYKTTTPLLGRSAPFTDTPTPGRYSDSSPRHGVDDDPTPRATGISSGSQLVTRGSSRPSSFLYPNSPSGLRTPVSGGSSPIPSPMLNPVLLPADMEEGGSSRLEAGDDEEKGMAGRRSSTFGSWTRIDSPLSVRSPVSPLFSPRQWDSGSWRRGSAKAVFGFGGLGIVQPGLGIGESEREREKRLELGSGWRDVSLGGLKERSLKRTSRLVRSLKQFGKNIAKLGKDIVYGKSVNGSFGLRMVWDAVLIAVPCWIVFGLVNWYIMS